MPRSHEANESENRPAVDTQLAAHVRAIDRGLGQGTLNPVRDDDDLPLMDAGVAQLVGQHMSYREDAVSCAPGISFRASSQPLQLQATEFASLLSQRRVHFEQEWHPIKPLEPGAC